MTHLNLHMMENCSNGWEEISIDNYVQRKNRTIDIYEEKLEKLFINVQEYCDMMNWPNSDKSQIVIDLKTENIIVDEKKMEEFL